MEMQGIKVRVTLAVALISIFLVSAICMAKAATIEVSPGESIQKAIDSAADGDLILVRSGNYSESLNITKAVALKGQGEPVIDAGLKGSAVTIFSDGVELSGFRVERSKDAGIKVVSSNNRISDNQVRNNTDGISLGNSNGNLFENNTVEDNSNGIVLFSSQNNTITENEICRNEARDASDCGICLEGSDGNLIIGNSVTENGAISINLRSSCNNTVEKNTSQETAGTEYL
jgi:nitrous oxidase accessory protein